MWSLSPTQLRHSVLPRLDHSGRGDDAPRRGVELLDQANVVLARAHGRPDSVVSWPDAQPQSEEQEDAVARAFRCIQVLVGVRTATDDAGIK